MFSKEEEEEEEEEDLQQRWPSLVARAKPFSFVRLEQFADREQSWQLGSSQ